MIISLTVSRAPKRHHLWGLVAVLFVLTPFYPIGAQTTVIVDTFGPGDSFGGGWYDVMHIEGFDMFEPEMIRYQGFPFSTTQTGLQVSKAFLAAQQMDGGGAFDLVITDDNAGYPGADLVTLTPDTPISTSMQVVTFTPTSSLVLTADDTYWLVARATFGGQYGWAPNDQASRDDQASYDGYHWEVYTNVIRSAFRVEAVQAPLPVELVAFTARNIGEDVLLQWRTASETSNAGFEVQHYAKDAAAQWENKGFVQGRGTAHEPGYYTFDVARLSPGTHRFRLKQINYDGTFAYSDEVETTIALTGKYYLSRAYPNPFNPTATLTLQIASDQQVHVAAYDFLGREVATLHQGRLAAAQTYRFTLSGSSWSSGTYFVRASGETFSATRQVLLIK